jgi:hypothetical protein
MSALIEEAKLKELLKTALVEVLEERREFVKDIVEEAMEEIAMTRAIEEGLATEASSREEVFELLDSRL